MSDLLACIICCPCIAVYGSLKMFYPKRFCAINIANKILKCNGPISSFEMDTKIPFMNNWVKNCCDEYTIFIRKKLTSIIFDTMTQENIKASNLDDSTQNFISFQLCWFIKNKIISYYEKEPYIFSVKELNKSCGIWLDTNIRFSDNESEKINNFLGEFTKMKDGTRIDYFTTNKAEICILEKKYISIISDVLSQINKSEITTIITSSLLYLDANNIQEQEEIDQLMKNKL
tara:strand:- start:79 stop:771 length:693 start_codon:yes stop_codon:yes gene_type:complete